MRQMSSANRTRAPQRTMTAARPAVVEKSSQCRPIRGVQSVVGADSPAAGELSVAAQLPTIVLSLGSALAMLTKCNASSQRKRPRERPSRRASHRSRRRRPTHRAEPLPRRDALAASRLIHPTRCSSGCARGGERGRAQRPHRRAGRTRHRPRALRFTQHDGKSSAAFVEHAMTRRCDAGGRTAGSAEQTRAVYITSCGRSAKVQAGGRDEHLRRP